MLFNSVLQLSSAIKQSVDIETEQIKTARLELGVRGVALKCNIHKIFFPYRLMCSWSCKSSVGVIVEKQIQLSASCIFTALWRRPLQLVLHTDSETSLEQPPISIEHFNLVRLQQDLPDSPSSWDKVLVIKETVIKSRLINKSSPVVKPTSHLSFIISLLPFPAPFWTQDIHSYWKRY